MICDQAAAHRKQIFTTKGVPNFTELSDARISALRPLQVDDYGIIVIPTGVMVGRGKFKSLILFEFNTTTFLQSLHFTPEQVAKMASIAQLATHQTFQQYLIWRFKFSNTCMLGNFARYQLPPQYFKLASISYFLQSIF